MPKYKYIAPWLRKRPKPVSVQEKEEAFVRPQSPEGLVVSFSQLDMNINDDDDDDDDLGHSSDESPRPQSPQSQSLQSSQSPQVQSQSQSQPRSPQEYKDNFQKVGKDKYTNVQEHGEGVVT
mmetsp:Transcript_3829/g.4510  ORF Transcript_3829/g.4510 Transcript_3829/m.4510 type:complete len:122 (+) Transcript_3829:253-618(+)